MNRIQIMPTRLERRRAMSLAREGAHVYATFASFWALIRKMHQNQYTLDFGTFVSGPKSAIPT